MGAGPGKAVAAPPAASPRYGLILSGRTVNEPDDRWVNGIHFEPEGCGDAAVHDVCDSGTKDAPDAPETVDYQPYAIVYGDSCAPFGFGARDWEAKVRRGLLAKQSKAVEAEFWSGAGAKANSWSNRYLASEASDVLSPGAAMEIMEALSCLEQGLADCDGQRGMIHATPQVVSLWAQHGGLRREGANILTILDTIVVPGAGYDGSGPLGQAAVDGSVWAYATGMVDIRLGDIDVLGGPNAEGLDRSLNTVEIFAERPAAATWDLCCHLTVQIDAPLCGIEGPGS